jgi:integrase
MSKIQIHSGGLVESDSYEQLNEVTPEVEWLANYTSDQTKSIYSDSLKQFSLFISRIGSGDVSDRVRNAKKAHILAFRNYLERNRQCKGATINTRLSALKSYFDYLVETSIISDNPVLGVKRMRVDQEKVSAPCLTKSEVLEMMYSVKPKKSHKLSRPAYLRAVRDFAILSTLFNTGSRVSEICSLKQGDYQQIGKCHVLVRRLKGGIVQRIAVNDSLKVALDDYLEIFKDFHRWNLETPLFFAVPAQSDIQPLWRSQILRIVRNRAAAVGLKQIRTHSARTTFITEASRVRPYEEVAAAVGHKSVRTTQRYDKRVFDHHNSAAHAVGF